MGDHDLIVSWRKSRWSTSGASSCVGVCGAPGLTDIRSTRNHVPSAISMSVARYGDKGKARLTPSLPNDSASGHPH